jgi:hypothetical protein
MVFFNNFYWECKIPGVDTVGFLTRTDHPFTRLAQNSEMKVGVLEVEGD